MSKYLLKASEKKLKLTVTQKKAITILRKVSKHIMAEPKRFGMWWWAAKGKEKIQALFGKDAVNPSNYPQYDRGEIGREDAVEVPRCGTVACIGGWIVLLESKAKHPRIDDTAGEQAEKILGIEDIGGKLFSQYDWTKENFLAYENAKSRKAKAKAAVNQIEHVIQTEIIENV